jgi:uncharacterized protein YkwD
MRQRGIARRAALALAVFATAAFTAPGAFASPRIALSPLERGVLAEINAVRVRHHLPKLRLNGRLTAAALAHSRQMAKDGYFAHNSHDGSPFWKRIQRFYASSPWRYWSVGENLLWSSPDIDAHEALELWLKSPEHRANLLSAGWREVGVAAVHATQAGGVFHGLDVTIVTTDFGVRR